MMADLRRCFEGVILGTAVGDAIGLPREGLSARRAMRMFGGAPLRHRLLFGRGMTSDDTEHTCMVAQALLAAKGDPERFARSFAWRLRWWMLGLPAGVELATARAILKLWVGFPPHRSGVWSAGNGPAMRAAILGVYTADDLQLLRELVHRSTRVTHTDPAAEHGAMAVALAAAYGATHGSRIDPAAYLELVNEQLDGTAMQELIEEVVRDVRSDTPFHEYLVRRGMDRGISGYINHTVPAAVFCWLRWPDDYRQAVEQVILAGGDADTTGAITGALVGITAGPEAIPDDWLEHLVEWPRSVPWMRELAAKLATAAQNPERSSGPVPLLWPALLLRNLLFLLVVLMHALRRLLPPY